MNARSRWQRPVWLATISFVLGLLHPREAGANPVGPSVVQGSATFNSSAGGAHFTIQQNSDRAFINWQSFDIGVGETTTFIQPSATSLAWNQINDVKPSQILGNLNANGYVVLQNQNGFYIGGQAAITTHGLMLTTAPLQMPDPSSASAWQFDAPPPTASIINYGQINVGGASAYLIAHDILNHGTISAPGGDIGLYSGKQLFLSLRPDGRGLSARVTLPEGSVDNSGKLVADAGSIAMHAQVVNQGGFIQANSVRNVNGTIELVAGDSVNLGAASSISAKGDSTSSSSSPGGFVILKAANSFADMVGSTISVSAANAGRDGVVEVLAPGAGAGTLQSTLDNHFALLVNPQNLTLSTSPTDTSSSNPNFNVNDLASFAQIDLQALNNIELKSAWTLNDPGAAARLTLNAGNSIIFDNFASLSAANNLSVSLTAGPGNLTAKPSDPRTDGIYLDGDSCLQTQDGNINLWAANEVIVNGGAVRTMSGGGIGVTAEFGDVNTGSNTKGYVFRRAAPYYIVSPLLGGISTAAGGNVNISAGGNVTSFLPLQNNYNDAKGDAGSGAFGSQPGNVTITAGGNVSGHYVLANGVGTITAGGDVGSATSLGGFALSLVKGSWNVFAPSGNIYVQDVRNPNGIFNDIGSASNPGYHLFDYDPLDSLLLQAGDAVEITGLGAPHTLSQNIAIPLLLPSSLQVVAGAGGFVLDTDVILFPSPEANLNIATHDGGNFTGVPDFTGIYPTLEMSDSGKSQWTRPGDFNTTDHGATPPEVNNPNPVEIAVSGILQTLKLYTVKETHITVGGDMINATFTGANLHPEDKTTIDVLGNIYNTPAYNFAYLDQAIISADRFQPQKWDSIFTLAVNPDLKNYTVTSTTDLKQLITSSLLFGEGKSEGSNPGFVYDPNTLRLGYYGIMTSSVRAALEGQLYVVHYDSDGLPVVVNGHLQLDPVSFVPSSVIDTLYQASQGVPSEPPNGYQIGGPGQFNISAASMNLGNTKGILSWGIGGPLGDATRYASLAGLTDSGAEINVNLTGDLDMLTSTIASMFGGDVNVNSVNGSLNLGSQDLFGTARFALGIYTSGHSDVSVTAGGDINIQGSRIAAYNGGNIFVKSLHGNVDAGSGGAQYVNVPLVLRDPNSGQAAVSEDPIYGSGIVAVSLPKNLQTAGGNPLPGDITVETPEGSIISSKAGILQLALDGNVSGGPTVTLVAGTPAKDGSPAIPGNIDLGESGLIGGTVSVTAEGDIKGLIVSRQNSSVNAAQNFSGTLLSAGTANIAAGGTVSGTVVGIGGVTASGAAGITATLLSQNVSANGTTAQSTLGTSATATATAQSAAQQATSDTSQQVAMKSTSDDDEKKKRNKHPITHRVGRVTVILPKSN